MASSDRIEGAVLAEPWTVLMLDESIVIVLFLGLAACAVLALRFTANSFKTAATTLIMAGILTPAIWVTADKHWARSLPPAFRSDPFEPSDYLFLYLPMSFFVATLISAALAVGLRRIVRASRTEPKSGLGKP